MRRDEIADLAAFVVVAEERSFTKAAVRLGMAQSALSQIVRRIEELTGRMVEVGPIDASAEGGLRAAARLTGVT